MKAITMYQADDGEVYETKYAAQLADRRAEFHAFMSRTGNGIGSWKEAAEWIEANAAEVQEFVGNITPSGEVFAKWRPQPPLTHRD